MHITSNKGSYSVKSNWNEFALSLITICTYHHHHIRTSPVAEVRVMNEGASPDTVEPPITDTPNSGHPPNNGRQLMYQLLFPLTQYIHSSRIADTSEFRTTDKCSVPEWLPCPNGSSRAPPKNCARRQARTLQIAS